MKIHIMPAKAFLRMDELGETSAAVISTWEGIDRERITVPYAVEEYMDLDYESPRSFSDCQAAHFAVFVRSLDRDSELYVCCDAGESRSPAIAAAIYRWLGESDLHIWEDPRFHPNMLCFRKMLEALGLEISDSEMDTLLYRNREAFRRAVKQ